MTRIRREQIETEFLTNAKNAFDYVKMVGGPEPELESFIAGDPLCAYCYAMDVVGAFPAGEQAIVGNLLWCVNYLNHVRARISPAENGIAGLQPIYAGMAGV